MSAHFIDFPQTAVHFAVWAWKSRKPYQYCFMQNTFLLLSKCLPTPCLTLSRLFQTLALIIFYFHASTGREPLNYLLNSCLAWPIKRQQHTKLICTDFPAMSLSHHQPFPSNCKNYRWSCVAVSNIDLKYITVENP